VLDYDPNVNLQHCPGISLLRYGLNPFGEPLYRIVLGCSRKSLGSNDGGVTFHWVEKYAPEYSFEYVLERWRSAWEFTGCTPEQWAYKPDGAKVLGPYPSRGEYEMVELPLACKITEANLDVLISWVEESRNRQMSPIGVAENDVALRDTYAAETKANRATSEAICRNALTPWLGNAFVSTSDSATAAKRGTKTYPILKTANDIGLIRAK
jgi:hypothetical protein